MDNTTISMDRFWNFVAIPYFFVILAFGAWTLFNFRSIQVTNQSIASRVATILGSQRAPVSAGVMKPAGKAAQPN